MILIPILCFSLIAYLSFLGVISIVGLCIICALLTVALLIVWRQAGFFAIIMDLSFYFIGEYFILRDGWGPIFNLGNQ